MSIWQMFSWPFMQRALIAGVLVSLCAALLGVSLVLKRYSMIGDGLSHVSFGALAIAVALGITPLYFSIPVVILAAFFLLRAADSPHRNNDAAIAAMSASSLAIGILVISRTSGMTTDVDSYMFGSVLAMSWGDVALSAVLCAGVLALFIFFYHKIFAVTFDENFSRATRAEGGPLQHPPGHPHRPDHRAGHADDGRHANLLPHHLPGPDRHAAVSQLPGRGALRRRHVGGLLLRGADHLLCLVHAGGRHRGGGGPGGIPGGLPDPGCPEAGIRGILPAFPLQFSIFCDKLFKL